MRKQFTWIAVAVCSALALVQLMLGPTGRDVLPLLTVLLISEVGAIVALVGALLGVAHMRRDGIGAKWLLGSLACTALLVLFVWFGLTYWPWQVSPLT